jgi:hypothetical protein
VEPKEPPQEAKVRMDESIKTLPDDEREILQLRFVDGFTQEEIANAIGCKPFLIALIEQRAVERLTEAFRDLGADGEIVRFWVAWWGEEKGKELGALVPATLTPTVECLSIGRIYEASLQWDWTEEERKHISSCARCRSAFSKVSKQVWHPSSRQLWDYVVRNRLTESERLDIHYHLEEDRGRRCTPIVEKILQPIATTLGFLIARQPRLEEEAVLYRIAFEEAGKAVLCPAPLPLSLVFAIATPTPIALTMAGFAREETEGVKIAEGDFKAELKREPEGWIARAEAFDVPEGLKVRFEWVTPEGVAKIVKEVKLRRAFRDWYFAEEKVCLLRGTTWRRLFCGSSDIFLKKVYSANSAHMYA